MKDQLLSISSKICLATTALLLTASTAFAKEKKADTGKEAAFHKGSKTIGLSVGFGVDYSYYYRATPLPAFGLTYDQGIIDHAGPGNIGVGGILAFKTARYNYGYGGYYASYTNYIVGVRGTWHLTILKEKNNKFDPYAGVTAGLRIYKYHDSYYDSYYSTYGYYPYSYSYNSVYPVIGVFVGAKYNFSKHFGAFAELGYDISFARIGLNANF